MVLAVVAAALALALAAPRPGRADQGLSRLHSQADRQRARERLLAADVARLRRMVARIEAQLATLERRRAEVRADIDADEARLLAVRAALRAEHARLVRLRLRLTRARGVLARRLVAMYQTPPQDIVTIALDAGSFSELLDRGEFLRLIGAQDERIVDAVRTARADARAAVERMAAEQARLQRVIAAMTARRNALASMSAAISRRRATLTRARAVRAATLRATRADRRRVEARIGALERAAAAADRGGGGPWAIPWPVVQCESGGQNLPPNAAGASGYYQILPSTWRLYGGSGHAAYLAPKGEQDRVAARIWQGGGPASWVCADLVGI